MPTDNPAPTPAPAPAPVRAIPSSLPVAPRDPAAEVERVQAFVAELTAHGVRADALADAALDHLERGQPERAAAMSQEAREQALIAGDHGTLALATAVLAAVRSSQGRLDEARTLRSDAELFLAYAGLHPQQPVTRRILDTLG